jgi:excisionase family DNA binding protein
MTNRPGRPRATIAPLSDHPDATMSALLERLATLLDRVPLTERIALDVEQTATYLSVSVDRVYQLKREGHLVPLKHLGHHFLFSREAIDAFVAASHDEARKVA